MIEWRTFETCAIRRVLTLLVFGLLTACTAESASSAASTAFTGAGELDAGQQRGGDGGAEWTEPLALTENGALPVVAIDPDGRGLALWTSSRGGSGRIHALRFDARGQRGAESTIETTGEVYELRGILDASGHATVAWLVREPGGAASGGRVQAARAAPGEGFDVAVELTANATTANASRPLEGLHLAADAGGHVFAAWSENGGVFARRFEPQAGWGPSAYLAASANVARELALAVSAKGTCVLLWRAVDPDERWRGAPLFARVFRPGADWSAPVQLGDSLGVTTASVAASSDDLVAVWTESFPSRVRTARFAVGTGWASPATLAERNVGSIYPDAEVVLDEAGAVTTVWLEFPSDDQGHGPDWTLIRWLGSRASGAEPSRLEARSDDVYDLHVVGSSSGDALILWAGFGDPYPVRAAALSRTGEEVPKRTLALARRRQPELPRRGATALAMNPRGEAMAVWENGLGLSISFLR